MRHRLNQLGQNWWQFVKNSWRAMGYAYRFAPKALTALIVVSSLAAILPFVQNRFFGLVIDGLITAVGKGVGSGLWPLIAAYGGLMMITPLLRAVRGFFEKHYFLPLQEGVELLVAERRSGVDIADLENKDFQDLAQRAFHRGPWPISATIDNQVMVLQSLTSVLVGSLITVWFDWRIYLIVVIFSVPKFIADVKYGKDLWSIHSQNSSQQRRFSDLRFHLINRISAIETQLYQSSKWVLDWMGRIINQFTREQLSAEIPRFKQVAVAELLSTSGFVLAMILIIQEVIAGQLPVGTMAFMIAALGHLDVSITGSLSSLARQYEASQYVADIFKVLDRPPVVIRALNPKPLSLNSAPEIVFEGVSFHYPNDPKPVLSDINLTIKPGEKLGLVGVNGAGKTTFVRLLCRIYDPTSGRITVNGHDLRDVSLDEWRSYLAVLLQDYTSFDFSTDQAIAMGRVGQEVREEVVQQAAAISGADSFIEQWPDRYKTMIGVEFGGQEPSKGQKQKLALARAIYRRGHVLVLDEPTASIDAESEIEIFKRLESLPDTVTVILISHRFNTLRQADRIAVIKDGTIAELGSHDELNRQNGWYAEMFKKQLTSYTKGGNHKALQAN